MPNGDPPIPAQILTIKYLLLKIRKKGWWYHKRLVKAKVGGEGEEAIHFHQGRHLNLSKSTQQTLRSRGDEEATKRETRGEEKAKKEKRKRE